VGNDLKSSWENLLAGKSGIAATTGFDTSDFSVKIAAELKDFDLESVIDKKERKRYDKFSIFSLLIAGKI